MFGRPVAVGVTALLFLSMASCSSASQSQPSDVPTGTGSAPATVLDVGDPTTTGVAPVETAATVPAATEPPASTSAASSTSIAPSTTLDDRPVNAVDGTLALAATLHAEDFPTAWSAYTPGEPFRTSPESCSYRAGGAVTQVSNGGGQVGPNMQLGETGAFAGSFVQVFPDESLAIEHIGVVSSEDWGVCRAGQLQQAQADAGSDNLVTVVTRDSLDLNQGGLESYAQFDVSSPDGTLNRVILFSFYRIGRTVIGQVLEYGGLSDTDFATFNTDTHRALTAAYARVNAL
jgi:hypothetical protein